MPPQPLFQLLARTRGKKGPVSPEVGSLSAMALGYELLSLGLFPPASDPFRTVRDNLTAPLLGKALEGAGLPCALGSRLFEVPLSILDRSYDHLFGVHGGALRETWRVPEGAREPLLGDLAMAYARASYTPPVNPPLPADHAATELSFAQILVLKEVEDLLLERDSSRSAEARRTFVARHLAGWLPRLADAVAGAGDGFHPLLLRAAADFVRTV